MSLAAGTNTVGISNFTGLLGRCRLNDETGCYEWAGALRNGSGVLWFYGVGVVALPTAFALCKTGAAAPPGRMWVPRCGNKLCCTESHRFLGTRSDLMRILRPTLGTAHRAKIRASCRRNGRSKYDPEIKAAILASDEPAVSLAPKLGLKHNLVSKIRQGQSWADVPASSVFAWRPT